MSRIVKISLIVLSMIMLFSCDYRKTHVINTVHADGSITRKVTVKTNTRKVEEATDKETAETALRDAISAVDKTAGARVIHRNKAARMKSRLTRLVASRFAS